MAAFVDETPSEVLIARDPFWVNVPREVGDGMEALPNQSIPSAPPHSSMGKVASAAGSRCSSPPTTFVNIDEGLYPEIFPGASNFSLTQSSFTFTDSEKFLIEEKAALKDHLEIQIQVNQEIKKLLVASVGDDVSYHYDRLSTEKAQLAKENDDLKSKLAAKKEEKERVEISCDVWRSKFLASRMQCDEAVAWRRAHEKQSRDLESAVRGFLRDHEKEREHVQQLLATLSHLDSSLNNGSNIAAISSDAGRSDVERCRMLANSLCQSLLELPSPCLETVLVPSPAEKHVAQILADIRSPPDQLDSITKQRSSEYQLARAVTSRLHAYNSLCDITLNCCPRCKGDVMVV